MGNVRPVGNIKGVHKYVEFFIKDVFCVKHCKAFLTLSAFVKDHKYAVSRSERES